MSDKDLAIPDDVAERLGKAPKGRENEKARRVDVLDEQGRIKHIPEIVAGGNPVLDPSTGVHYADGSSWTVKCHSCNFRQIVPDRQTAEALAVRHVQAPFELERPTQRHFVLEIKDTGGRSMQEFPTQEKAFKYVARLTKHNPGILCSYISGWQQPEEILAMLGQERQAKRQLSPAPETISAKAEEESVTEIIPNTGILNITHAPCECEYAIPEEAHLGIWTTLPPYSNDGSVDIHVTVADPWMMKLTEMDEELATMWSKPSLGKCNICHGRRTYGGGCEGFC